MVAFIDARAHQRESTRDRYDQAFREPVLARFASRRLLETHPADILQLIKDGTVSTNMYFRRLHSCALMLGCPLLQIQPCYSSVRDRACGSGTMESYSNGTLLRRKGDSKRESDSPRECS